VAIGALADCFCGYLVDLVARVVDDQGDGEASEVAA
jgi:hypothetical protein